MAGSRLEKIGTIYTRTRGLLKAKALNWEDRPLWYDVYEAFPPKEEPVFDRPIPKMTLKKIFYKEDKIRALFHANNKQIGSLNMFNNKSKSLTQRFIENYQKLYEQYQGKVGEEQIYQEAIEFLTRDTTSAKNAEDNINISSAFKVSQDEKNKINVKVSDILKD